MVLALLLPVVAGWAVLAWLDPCGRYGCLETLGRSFLAGQLLLCLLFFGFSVLCAQVPVWILACLLGLCGLTGLIPWSRGSIELRPSLRPHTLMEASAAGLTVLVLAGCAVQLWLKPIIAYDAWAIYAVKTVSFFHHRAIDPEFLKIPYPHPDYPPLVSVGGAWNALFAGTWDHLWAKLHLPFYLASGSVILAGVVSRATNRAWGWFTALVFALTPQVYYTASQATCDLPLAVFLLAGIATGWEAAGRARPGALGPVTVFLAGAAWTKNDGSPQAVLILLVICLQFLAGSTRSGLRRRRLILPWIGLIIPVMAWWWYKTSLGLSSDMINADTVTSAWLAENIGRTPGILRHFVHEMIYSVWGDGRGGRWLQGWTAFWIALSIWLVKRRTEENGSGSKYCNQSD